MCETGFSHSMEVSVGCSVSSVCVDSVPYLTRPQTDGHTLKDTKDRPGSGGTCL